MKPLVTSSKHKFVWEEKDVDATSVAGSCRYQQVGNDDRFSGAAESHFAENKDLMTPFEANGFISVKAHLDVKSFSVAISAIFAKVGIVKAILAHAWSVGGGEVCHFTWDSGWQVIVFSYGKLWSQQVDTKRMRRSESIIGQEEERDMACTVVTGRPLSWRKMLPMPVFWTHF